MQRSTLSVGPALRTVREGRGLTLEEAARDTRVRPEFLEALEAEEFYRLLGDVHVRGCLRTYAAYLRLSPDKVVAAYEAEHAASEEIGPLPPPVTEPVLGGRRRRDDHRLWILVAATILVIAAAFGILSARRPAPPPAELSGEATVAPAQVTRGITVAVQARRPVMVTIVIDGGPERTYELRADEGRSFDAESSVWIRLSEGDTARIVVSGVDYGFPGTSGKPWEETFSYEQPSATGP